MPYISKDRRKDIFNFDEYQINVGEITTGGELQYAIAVIIKQILSLNKDNYATREMIMGALAGAQMEFYRQHVVAYEDGKIKENGHV